MRVTTWENIGTAARSNDLDQLLVDADLNYEAEARDVYYQVGDSKLLVPNKKMIVRADTNQPFGIVSESYSICQNKDAFDFIQYIDGITLKKAGQTKSGKVYMIGELPEIQTLGDSYKPNIIFQNSHDGSVSVMATICMLRIICQNQLISAFKDSPATISIRHTARMSDRLAAAQQTLRQVTDYVKNFSATMEELATKHITPAMFNAIVANYFTTTEDMSDRKKDNVEADKTQFIAAYNAEDNQNFKGTSLGVINAFTDFSTHRDVKRNTSNGEEARFLYTLNPKVLEAFMNKVSAIQQAA